MLQPDGSAQRCVHAERLLSHHHRRKRSVCTAPSHQFTLFPFPFRSALGIQIGTEMHAVAWSASSQPRASIRERSATGGRCYGATLEAPLLCSTHSSSVAVVRATLACVRERSVGGWRCIVADQSLGARCARIRMRTPSDTCVVAHDSQHSLRGRCMTHLAWA